MLIRITQFLLVRAIWKPFCNTLLGVFVLSIFVLFRCLLFELHQGKLLPPENTKKSTLNLLNSKINNAIIGSISKVSLLLSFWIPWTCLSTEASGQKRHYNVKP